MPFHQSEKLGREHNDIFVFGSNLAGRHGKGAALHAAKVYGAIRAIGEGAMGKSYAIPTKDQYLRPRSLSEIEHSVSMFLSYAQANPNKIFWVTRVGCGLAGYLDHDIAPFFRNAPRNCVFPMEWKMYLTCVDY
jgi:hypothetical protein